MILNKTNGKYYIGSAINLLSRKTKHFTLLKLNQHPNIHLQKSCNKHGIENFEFKVLEFISNVKIANDLLIREQYWVDELNACDNKKGYNKRKIVNSNLGLKQSDEARRKNSESKKGRKVSEETRKKLSEANRIRLASEKNSMYGKHHSEEIKRKISIANTGQKKNNASYRKTKRKT